MSLRQNAFSHCEKEKNWKGMRYTMDIMKKDFCCVTLNKVTLEQGSES